MVRNDKSGLTYLRLPDRPDLSGTSDWRTRFLKDASRFSESGPVPALRLERALTTVDPQKIREDVFYIASDEMAGRDTPSEGLTKTQHYMRDRFESLGWLPGGPKRSFFYSYTLRSFPIDTGLSRLTFTFGNGEETLVPGRDYFYTAVKDTKNLEITGEAVFVGPGTKADIRTGNLKGRWIIATDSNMDPWERRALALEAGARGVIIIPGDDNTDAPYRQKISTYLQLAADHGLNYSNYCQIDEIFLSPQMAERILFRIKPEYVGSDPFPLVMVSEKRILEKPAQPVEASNVVAFFRGSDPELAKDVILISAHIDHLGKRWGNIYNGADDNASGTAALLALAQAIPVLNPRRSVMILGVSGEEKGLLGSSAWADNPYLPEGTRPFANINLDMIGRNAPGQLLFTPTRAHSQYNPLSELAETLFLTEGFTDVMSADRYWRRSDHYSFSRLGIPVIFLTTGTHADYHRPTDTAEKLDYDKLSRVVRLVIRMLAAL